MWKKAIVTFSHEQIFFNKRQNHGKYKAPKAKKKSLTLILVAGGGGGGGVILPPLLVFS